MKLSLKQRFKCINNQLAHPSYISPNDELNLDDPIPDALFAPIMGPRPAVPIFQLSSIEKLTVAQFYNAFYVHVHRFLKKGVLLAYGKNDN